ncbi:MAG: hypothetical protein WAN36_10940 [Calditrichia bacterium]
MKWRLTAAVFLIMIIFGKTQAQGLQIEVRSLAEASQNRYLDVRFAADGELSNGFVLQYPASLQISPISVQVEGRSRWLQQGLQSIVADSLAGWKQETGVITFYTPVAAGGQVYLTFLMALPFRGEAGAREIVLQPLLPDNTPLFAPGPSSASGLIPQINSQVEP